MPRRRAFSKDLVDEGGLRGPGVVHEEHAVVQGEDHLPVRRPVGRLHQRHSREAIRKA